METFLNFCKINKYKNIFLHLNNQNQSKQLIISFYHTGIYPDIIEQIQLLINTQFKDFNILRLKIKSLTLDNNGIPENDIDKLLFWNKKSSYFEFHYKILIKSTRELMKLKDLCRIQSLYLTHNAFKEISNNKMYYFVTMRLFDVGRIHALNQNDYIIQYSTVCNFSPLKIKKEFVIYDSDINFDHRY
ncbi:unnamed protein product [Adineta steineri]|uniref:Uncharacterized protein n=1 Tax=Adineta steineri TaxID=433720 RepID=A0A814ZWL9_9BILA|nr:unnamed protein product [Adineta steineri]CAF4052012.1 unnamed protein product [Adineta steineri]